MTVCPLVIVFFHAAFGVNKWHKCLCFMVLQGESSELENVLFDFEMCCIFYRYFLFIRSH